MSKSATSFPALFLDAFRRPNGLSLSSCTGRGRRRSRLELHERQPVKVNRLSPVLSYALKRKAAVGRCRPSDNRVATLDHDLDLVPDALSHAPSVDADVHTRAYFCEPKRQSPAQARRGVF